MNNKQYVIRACQMLKVDLLPPTSACPHCIIGTWWDNRGFGHSVIDASTWQQAREQLDNWRQTR